MTDIEKSIEVIASQIEGNSITILPELIRHMAFIHTMQANVIQGERALREKAEAELRDRELHHFETEQKLEKFAEYVKEIHHDKGDGVCARCERQYPCSEFTMAEEALA